MVMLLHLIFFVLLVQFVSLFASAAFTVAQYALVIVHIYYYPMLRCRMSVFFELDLFGKITMIRNVKENQITYNERETKKQRNERLNKIDRTYCLLSFFPLLVVDLRRRFFRFAFPLL